MRSLESWLSEYQESHQHPINKLIHWLCIPLIIFSTAGLLWSIPLPDSMSGGYAWINPATLSCAAAMVFYLMRDLRIAAGMAVWFGLTLAAVAYIATLAPIWLVGAVIFVGAWVIQIWGHKVEGRKPSFFKDLSFLLVGPAWVMTAIFHALGIAK